MSRHKDYLHKISRMLGRGLFPKEYPKFGKVIKSHSDEVLEKALITCVNATNVTDLATYFIYLCSAYSNKEYTKEMLQQLEGMFTCTIE